MRKAFGSGFHSCITLVNGGSRSYIILATRNSREVIGEVHGLSRPGSWRCGRPSGPVFTRVLHLCMGVVVRILYWRRGREKIARRLDAESFKLRTLSIPDLALFILRLSFVVHLVIQGEQLKDQQEILHHQPHQCNTQVTSWSPGLWIGQSLELLTMDAPDLSDPLPPGLDASLLFSQLDPLQKQFCFTH
jgi:hypothetical protein